jgi:hypothetical protein
MTHPADVRSVFISQKDVRTGVDPLSFALKTAPRSGETREIDALVDRDEDVRIVRVPLPRRERANERDPLNARDPPCSADEVEYETE